MTALTYPVLSDFIGPMIVLVISALIITGGLMLLKLLLGGGTATQKIESAKRGYYYLISFITLSVVFFAASDMFNLILTLVFGTTQYGYTYDNFARSIALRAATLFVALPVYVYHWATASKIIDNEEEDVRNFELKERKGYAQIVLVFSTLILLVFGVRLVYTLLLFGLGVSGTQLSDFSSPLSYTIVILSIWAYHLKVLKES